jgi:hypothetical protein
MNNRALTNSTKIRQNSIAGKRWWEDPAFVRHKLQLEGKWQPLKAWQFVMKNSPKQKKLWRWNCNVPNDFSSFSEREGCRCHCLIAMFNLFINSNSNYFYLYHIWWKGRLSWISCISNCDLLYCFCLHICIRCCWKLGVAVQNCLSWPKIPGTIQLYAVKIE